MAVTLPEGPTILDIRSSRWYSSVEASSSTYGFIAFLAASRTGQASQDSEQKAAAPPRELGLNPSRLRGRKHGPRARTPSLPPCSGPASRRSARYPRAAERAPFPPEPKGHPHRRP